MYMWLPLVFSRRNLSSQCMQGKKANESFKAAAIQVGIAFRKLSPGLKTSVMHEGEAEPQAEAGRAPVPRWLTQWHSHSWAVRTSTNLEVIQLCRIFYYAGNVSNFKPCEAFTMWLEKPFEYFWKEHSQQRDPLKLLFASEGKLAVLAKQLRLQKRDSWGKKPRRPFSIGLLQASNPALQSSGLLGVFRGLYALCFVREAQFASEDLHIQCMAVDLVLESMKGSPMTKPKIVSREFRFMHSCNPKCILIVWKQREHAFPGKQQLNNHFGDIYRPHIAASRIGPCLRGLHYWDARNQQISLEASWCTGNQWPFVRAERSGNHATCFCSVRSCTLRTEYPLYREFCLASLAECESCNIRETCCNCNRQDLPNLPRYFLYVIQHVSLSGLSIVLALSLQILHCLHCLCKLAIIRHRPNFLFSIKIQQRQALTCTLGRILSCVG